MITGRERTANGLEPDERLKIMYQNGNKLGSNGLGDVAEYHHMKYQNSEKPFFQIQIVRKVLDNLDSC